MFLFDQKQKIDRESRGEMTQMATVSLYPSIKLLQPENPNKATKVFFGKRSGLLDWDNIPYPQMYEIYQILQANYWVPREITLKNDVNQWEIMQQNPTYANAYLRSIGLLQTLDSSQMSYIYGLSRVLSDKAFETMLVNIANMEGIHNEDYTFILGSVTGRKEHRLVLDQTVQDKLLQKRNSLVFDIYEDFLNAMPSPTPAITARSLVGNSILEGIDFIATFAFFYSLHHHKNLMGGTVNHIQYINRDEAQHAFVMSQMYRILAHEYPEEVNTQEMHAFAHETMKKAVDLEIEWANYLFGDVDFVDMVDFEDYIKFVANKRMVQLGYDPIYKGLEDEGDNPFPWINAYEQPNLLRGDFFEETLLYSNNAVSEGVDDF
jgi:ribonucleoside-diphosphate reductase beta chain